MFILTILQSGLDETNTIDWHEIVMWILSATKKMLLQNMKIIDY